MVDAVVSRPGAVLDGPDKWETFRDVYSGEVLTAFKTTVNLQDKQRTRQISHGKSASFPMIYKAGSRYHTVGTEILGQKIMHAEKNITLDDKLISDVFIADIDEAMNHYEYRSQYSSELGQALAETYDKNIARNLILAARGSHTFEAGYDDGSTLVNAGYANDANILYQAILDGQQVMEEKDVAIGRTPVYLALKPAQWYLLQKSDRLKNKDYSASADTSRKNETMVEDVTVIRSNAYPWGEDHTVYNAGSNTDGLIDHPTDPNAIASADLPSKYRLDMANTVGCLWTPDAVGTIQLMGMSVQVDEQIHRQGTLTLGRLAVGHGPLRNQCSVELATA